MYRIVEFEVHLVHWKHAPLLHLILCYEVDGLPCVILSEGCETCHLVGEPDIQKLEKKWPESSRILDYILSYYGVSEV